MDGDLTVDPVIARQGAAELAGAARTLTDGRRVNGAHLEDEGAAKPWGADTLGQAFQTNYDQIGPAVLEAWARLGSSLNEYATGVTTAIDAAVAADDAARQRMTW
jgi:hypothetical protein